MDEGLYLIMVEEKELYGLTKRQRAVLKYIARFYSKKGYSPSIRDICKGVGLSSSSSVHLHLKTLEDRGFIKRDSAKPRTIEVMVSFEGEKNGDERIADQKERDISSQEKKVTTGTREESFLNNRDKMGEYPLLKGYSQNVSLTDPSNVECYITLPDFIAGREDAFLLRMMNDSMIGAGIFEGDLVIIYPEDEVNDGEIAALFSGGNVTIKRVFRHMNAYRLEPENRKMNPVFVKEIQVLGKLQGLIRPASGKS
jgi:repressor LexA